ncbi:MAG: hypothetical protein J6A38_01730 [Clostridia bacterium]|nr:hypothetical protein [Clostridia bacterium]
MEKEPVDTIYDDEPKVIVKKKGGWLGRIIALLLGFILGIGTTVGSVALVLTKVKINKSTEFVGKFVDDFDFSELVEKNYVSEAVGNMTILELVKETSNAAKSKTLGGFSTLFPFITEKTADITDQLREDFGVQLDDDVLLNTPFTELSSYLGDAVKTTPLGNFLEAAAKDGEELDPLLLEICYGEYGVDYSYDADGNIVMKEGKTPVTLETLSSDPMSTISKIALASAIPNLGPDDDILNTLAYGEKGVTYEYVTVNGKSVAQMKQKFLTFDGTSYYDYEGNVIDCQSSAAENGFVKIVETLTSGDKTYTETYYVKDVNGNEQYLAFETPEETATPVLFKKTLIGELTEDAASLVDGLYLKDALNITAQSHQVLISLAYGKKGTDYQITGDAPNQTIECINGAKPRTIGYLKEHNTTLINQIQLSDVLEEDPENKIVMYLLLGKENAHYQIDPITGKPVMLQRRVAINATLDKAYNEYGEEYPAGYALNFANKTFVENGVEYKISTQAVDAFGAPATVKIGEKLVVGTEHTYEPVYATLYYLTDANGNPVNYEKHTLGDLSGTNNLISSISSRLTVSEVFGEEKTAGNSILKHLGECTIEGLPSAVERLTFGQVFEADIFVGERYSPTASEPESFTDVNGHLVQKGDFIYVDGSGNTCFLPMEHRQVKGTWKYLLADHVYAEHLKARNQDSDPTNDLTLAEINQLTVQHGLKYSIAGEMGNLMENMSYNIHHSPLNDMAADGLIQMSTNTLHHKIRHSGGTGDAYLPGVAFPSSDTSKTEIGELNVDELVVYLDNILTWVDSLPLGIL